MSICNDLFVKVQGESNDKKRSMLIGDAMSMLGAFGYGLGNILQEHILKSRSDIFHYTGFLGFFGLTIAFIESLISRQFFDLVDVINRIDDFSEPSSGKYFDRNPGAFLALNLLGMSITNFMCYSLIPFFVTKSGATLLNISNVTTVLWGMLFDMTIFGQPFYILYLCAFCLEIFGIILFS